MNPHPGTFPHDSDPQLQAVQALLERDALEQAPPAGLAARVYGASLAFLPGRARARMSFAWEATVVGHIPVWGRLAMAALIALAFALATRSLVTPKPTPVRSMLTASVLLDDKIAGLDRAAAPAGSAIEGLVLTGEMTLDDLAAEVAMLFADLDNT